MSVLIKGMEMPHNCFFCPLSVMNTVMNGERLYCEVTKDEVLRAKIAQDCPLIELPPHGRLIDADALLNKLQALFDERADEARYTGSKEIKVSWDDAVYQIINAPTIIEAEEGE